MILERINLSTGPVNVSAEVKKAFSAPAISHRSIECKKLFDDTTELLSRMFSVRKTFIMSGSGTLANEAMLHQVKMLNTKGLILSNGEFGSRLVHQAKRISLNFEKYQLDWGQSFDIEVIKSKLKTGDIKWVLFCHCETSTGVLNDLDAIAEICNSCNCHCFADCISSVGTIPLNLSKVSIATASSGKGLASYSGLALLLFNIKPMPGNNIPLYYDISHYEEKENIPFTISSNLLHALYTSLVQKMTENQPGLIQKFCDKYFSILNAWNLVPFNNHGSKIFTIILPKEKSAIFIDQMAHKQVVLSYESGYLKTRAWSQLALFGYYCESQLKYAAAALEESLQSVF
jgi:aspartate aminotransferase-like enzyme